MIAIFGPDYSMPVCRIVCVLSPTSTAHSPICLCKNWSQKQIYAFTCSRAHQYTRSIPESFEIKLLCVNKNPFISVLWWFVRLGRRWSTYFSVWWFWWKWMMRAARIHISRNNIGKHSATRKHSKQTLGMRMTTEDGMTMSYIHGA